MSVKKNFIYNALYQIFTMIMPIITTPYISRAIGAEGLGMYSYSYSIAHYFLLFSMLGINNHGNRRIASVRDDKEKLSEAFSSIFYLKIITSLLMIIIYIIYIILFEGDNIVISTIQLIYILSAMIDINWFFFGIEKFKITVNRNIIIKVLSFFSIFLFVKDSSDLWIYTLIMALTTFLSQSSLWLFIHKYVSFSKLSIKLILTEVKPCLVMFIPVISVSIYKFMDKIMLGSMTDMSQVGFYENSEKIIQIPILLITALGTVMLPKITNLNANRMYNESRRYLYKSMNFAMFISIGSCFGLMGISSVLIPVFLGIEFIDCIKIINILAPSTVFIAWASVIRTQYLIPNKEDKVYINSTIIGALINVIVNMLLISKYRAIGVSVGTLLAEVSVAFCQTISIRKNIEICKYIAGSIQYLISGMIMYFVVEAIDLIQNSYIITLLVKFLVGSIIYILLNLLILAIVNNFNKEDKKLKFKITID